MKLWIAVSACGMLGCAVDSEPVDQTSEPMIMVDHSFVCTRATCHCSGGEDCNDMFTSGLCKVGPGTKCSETECQCDRK